MKTALLILDGWGINPNPTQSAIAAARTPFMDALWRDCPHCTLVTHGEAVGLPEGQMGNSEVGHLNLGAGRVVYQELARINKAVRERELHQNPTLLRAIAYARQNGKALHLLGLVSDGGVHAHITHLKALCDIAAEQGLSRVFVHAFTDGRDTDPRAGWSYLTDLCRHLQGGTARLASVVGRYYAMDRDRRWERIKTAYDLLVEGKGTPTQDPLQALQSAYQTGTSDEFVLPIVCTDAQGKPLATIQPGDAVLCFNFRTDRLRQLTEALHQNDLPEQGMKRLPLHYCTMTRYDEAFRGIEVLFEKDDLKDTLGEVLERAGKTQLRIAETEKYPHVTFFFSGGREQPFRGETRALVASPKVATYDLQPEMSAPEVTERALQAVAETQPDFICLNYANADMVGHTGVFQAAVRAVETVDACLARLVPSLQAAGYAVLILADHGNSDYMVNADGSPNTAHTTNPVPCILAGGPPQYVLKEGKLADVAPTLLTLMGLEIPNAMDGKSLLA